MEKLVESIAYKYKSPVRNFASLFETLSTYLGIRDDFGNGFSGCPQLVNYLVFPTHTIWKADSGYYLKLHCLSLDGLALSSAMWLPRQMGSSLNKLSGSTILHSVTPLLKINGHFHYAEKMAGAAYLMVYRTGCHWPIPLKLWESLEERMNYVLWYSDTT